MGHSLPSEVKEPEKWKPGVFPLYPRNDDPFANEYIPYSSRQGNR